jgi:hypothetical protein
MNIEKYPDSTQVRMENVENNSRVVAIKSFLSL